MSRFLTTWEAPVATGSETPAASASPRGSAPSSSSPTLVAAAAVAASRPARSPLRPSRPFLPSTFASPALSSSTSSASTPRTYSGSTALSSPCKSPPTAPAADFGLPLGPGAPAPRSLGVDTAALLSLPPASVESTMRPPTQVVTSNPVSYYDSTASTSDDEQHDQSRATRRSRNRGARASAGPSSTVQTAFEGPFRRGSYEVLPGPPSTSTSANGAPQYGSLEPARGYGRAGTWPSVPARRLSQQSDASRTSALAQLNGTNAQNDISPEGLGLQNIEYGAEGPSRRELLASPHQTDCLPPPGTDAMQDLVRGHAHTGGTGEGYDGRNSYVPASGETAFSSANEFYSSRSPVFPQSSPTSPGEGRFSTTSPGGGSPALGSGPPRTKLARPPPVRQARSTRFLPDQVHKHERGRNGNAGSALEPRHPNGSGSSFRSVELQPDHIVFPDFAPAPSQTRRSRSPASIPPRRSGLLPANAFARSSTTSNYDSGLLEYSGRPASIRSVHSSNTATESESRRLYFPPPPPKQSPNPASNASLVFPSAPRPAPRSLDATQDGGPFPGRPRASPKARSPVVPSASSPVSSERSIRTSALPFLGLALSFGKTSPTKPSSPFPLVLAPSLQSDPDSGPEDELDQMIRAQRRGASPVQAPRFASTSRSPKETNVYDELLGEVDKVELKVAAVNLGRTVPAASRSAAPTHAVSRSESLSAAFDEALAAPHTRQRTISGDTVASDSSADYFDANEGSMSPLRSLESSDGDGKHQNGIPRTGHPTSASDQLRRMSAIGEEAEEEAEEGDRRNSISTLRRRSSPRNSKNLSILPPPIVESVRSPESPRDAQAMIARTPPPRPPPSLALSPGPPLSSPSSNMLSNRDLAHSASANSIRSMPSTPNRTVQSPGRSMYSLSNESSVSTRSYAGSVATSTRSTRSITKRFGNFFSGTSSASSSPRTKSFGAKNGQLNMVGISSEAIRAAGLFQDDGPEVLNGEGDPQASSTQRLMPRLPLLEHGNGASSSSLNLYKASEQVTQLEGLFARFEREEKERLKGITAHRTRNASAPAVIGVASVT
ncbi:BZ3500_MvSof-1268-A1-R1_Chr3-1g06073 [Microbotryum saponariae]|uniref:BZ3500_MvSof-1268-A1-R1_Chr3-1g06073 protein n=1 Tax=Microbotryum saponariae TaxID=289078 RepID=A0A2X0KZ87_9BASI|nr:BZ3500_MvSof-1268-A1-R1_Chr3-1g06073 [Microbotryum saponariae]SDA03913.1 BZ3501_MvSof-1269-A2-R1_Chr3-2g05758 [Microbotryum saponariae]